MPEPKLTKATRSGRERAPGADTRDTRVDQDVARATTQDERVEAEQRSTDFRSEWVHEALPTPPEIPGFHLCWLSTTNSYDPIHRRIRMGYSPVKVEEVPGLEVYKVHSGEHTGYVSVNEMLLFKIPMERYQQIMAEFHHHMPREEESKIRENVERLQEATKDSQGQTLIRPEEGISELGRARKVPTFQ